MNHYDNDGHDHNRTTRTEQKAKGAGLGIGAIVIIALIAIAAYFMFNNKNDTARSAGNDVGRATQGAVQGTTDVLKEVPQAGKDAVTPGDQNTTRPNADNSTGKLDQK